MVVLLTGAGAPGTRGTLYALRRGSLNTSLRVIGVDTKSDTVGRYLADAFYRIPEPEENGYVVTLAALCDRERVSVLIPQTTREIGTLSHHRDRFAGNGVAVMVSDAPAIATANNKWKLMEVCERLGIPVPRYELAESEDALLSAAASLGYPSVPVVVKPPVSNGMRGVRVLREGAWDAHRFLTEKPSGLEISLEELVGILRRGNEWPQLLVSEYLPGPEYTVDLFFGSLVRVALPRRRVAIRSGITFQSVLEPREDLRDFSLRLAERIGLRYAVGFQFKLDANGTPRILECNPRVQGTMVASAFGGANIIWLAVRELTGDPPTETPPISSNGSFYRFWGGVSVLDGTVEEI